MKIKNMTREKILWTVVSAFFLILAFWLVSPFIKIEPSDYAHAAANGFRLAVGLLIFIMYSGKWAFDAFAPQGLAKRVSGIRATWLIIFNLLLVCFIILIIAHAAALYLQTGISQDAANF